MQSSAAFDDLGGEFRAKLRDIVSTTRQTADGNSTVTFSTARIDCEYTPGVIKRLATGQLLAIPNVQTLGGDDTFSLYEIADVFPMHYSMLTLDQSQPAAIRREFMELIENEWKNGSKSTWIEIVAAPIGYVMKSSDGGIAFERRSSAPLTGSPVKLLSRESVQKLICYNPPNDQSDYRFGNLLGVVDETIGFTVNIEKLLHFHVGVFAFSLDHDEPIVYRENGEVKITEIGELVDRFFLKDEEGRKYTSSLEVVSFNPETYEIGWTPIQYVFRHAYRDKLLRFTLRTGRNVAVTPGHSLFVLRKGKILCLPASDLTIGDFVVGTRAIPDPNSSNPRVNLGDLFEGKAAAAAASVYLENVSKDVFERLDHGKNVPNWKWRRWRHFGKLPLTYWDRLTETERRPLVLSYKGAETAFAPILEIDEDIARLLGYYAAEGQTIIENGLNYEVTFTLSRDDKKTVKELRRILRTKFGIKTRTLRDGENGLRLAFRNRIVATFLKKSAGSGARRKIVPKAILNSPHAVRREFLRAWAEGDHPISSSRRLANDLLYALLFDECAGAVNRIKPNKPTMIEGKRVRSRGRYRFSFPGGKGDMRGVIGQTRGRAEPTYPASELPRSLLPLLRHPSHINNKDKLGLSARMFSEMKTRLDKFMPYNGSSSKSVDEARHDGVYRTGMTASLTKKGNTIQASPNLVQAAEDLQRAMRVQESLLGFYEVQEIEQVSPSSDFVYDVSVPVAENFLAGFGGIFCHNTGSGKSNLTATVVRKALKVIPDLKVVFLDVSSEYGIHILDVLNKYPSRVFFTDSFAGSKRPAAEYFKRHVCPESLSPMKDKVEEKISSLFEEGKVVFAEIPAAGHEDIARFSTYGGLIEILTGTLEDRYGAVQQKLLIPQVINKIKAFMAKEGLTAESRFDAKTAQLTSQVEPLLAGLRENSSLKSTFDSLKKVVDEGGAEAEKSAWETLPDEILSTDKDSPRVFVLNLPEAEDARAQTADLINQVFRRRKKSFSLTPQVLFIVDEAQEFIPQDARKGDNAFESSRAVERLLRHGRKYNLYCWVSTQRIAHLNTNALQQLHSYFISTMPRPYDRQLVSDTFAIGDAFIDRTLSFQNGDWLITSFKATATQNIPVFFHAENNEETLRKYLSE